MEKVSLRDAETSAYSFAFLKDYFDKELYKSGRFRRPLSVVFLVTLAIAPARSHFTEWRAVQERYNALARDQGKESIEPAIQQLWKPRMGIVDRCTSCHVGMGAAEPVCKNSS